MLRKTAAAGTPAAAADEPYGTYRAEATTVLGEWSLYGLDEYDVAVITLDRPVPEAAGSVSLLAACSAQPLAP
jgi:hypothetical protein